MENKQDIVLKVDNLGKLYQLGQIGTGTISHDLNRWWARMRGKEDPLSKVGSINDRTQKAQKLEKVWALKDINFQVNRGEVLGIIGKNGAGKSTLLKLISNITAPTTGSIKAKGRIAALLEVGTGMHPEMTGRENVFLNGTILGMRRREIEKKFDDIMDFAGCTKYADTPVKRYSSGMKVRLGFAVAAFLEPEILIVDEVLAVGDAEFQKRAIGKMQDVSNKDGRTVLFVSHNMASIKALCPNSILLNNGSISCVGRTSDVISYYQNNANSSLVLSREWQESDAPGSESIKLIKASIIPDSDTLDIDSGFALNISLLNRLKNKNIGCTLRIINSEEIVVFTIGEILSQNRDSEEGVYQMKFIVPPMLNADQYSIDIIVGENQQHILIKESRILNFEVANVMTNGIIKQNVVPGVVRPKINCQVSVVKFDE